MAKSPNWGLVTALLSRIPLILTTLLLNLLSLSPASPYQTTQVEIVTTVLRSLLKRQRPLAEVQEEFSRDPGIKGSVWISKVVLAAPEADGTQSLDEKKVLSPREALIRAIEQLGDAGDTFQVPDVADVEAEWTGYRSGVSKDEPRLAVSEEEQYQRLMSDANRTGEATILYLHGGAYVVLDPSSHRKPVQRLTKLTHGRALSVRYRLAPQNPFPAALLDAFVAYLSLLYPPPGSFHGPVPANCIVISGDSAGGGLSTSLLLLLLTLKRLSITKILFHGAEVPLILPGGLALTSPWVDITRAFPSGYRNEKYDYIFPPSISSTIAPAPLYIPPDRIWPTKPPRVDTYCDASIILNPLVSPITAKADLWKGHPPVWISFGYESLSDECLILAHRLAATGPTVVEHFEGQPHVFAFLFFKVPFATDFFNSISNFIVAVANQEKTTSEKVVESKSSFRTRKHGVQPLELEKEVRKFVGSEADIDRLLLAGKAWRVKAEKEMLEKWDGGKGEGVGKIRSQL